MESASNPTDARPEDARFPVDLASLCLLGLTFAAFFVVLNSADQEPYEYFRRSDAIIQVGVASVIIAGIAIWIATALWGMFANKRFSLWQLFGIVWALALFCALGVTIDANFQDIEQFVISGISVLPPANGVSLV